VLGLTPQLARGLLEAGARDWPAATRIDLFGAAPGAALIRDLQRDLTANLSLLYGATETGSVARAGPAALLADPDDAGPILPNAELVVVDAAGAPLPAGETGLLRMRTRGMATRYMDDASATARCFVQGWFQPGDRGRLLPGGRLRIEGRGDDMMILGTLNIFPAEIERAAEGFPGVAECAAFARHSAVQGDIPMLAVVARDGFDAAALLAHCRERLGQRAPRKVVVVPALPRNAAGKVLRRDLALGVARDPPGRAEAPLNGGVA
jgi:acyl-CoA synthetase (AMP-forming)/AMP-acid ligase II